MPEFELTEDDQEIANADPKAALQFKRAPSGHLAQGTHSTHRIKPHIDRNHVSTVQALLAQQVDPSTNHFSELTHALQTQVTGKVHGWGTWGPKTQHAYEDVCGKAGVDAKTVDFTDPQNEGFIKLSLYLRANAKGIGAGMEPEYLQAQVHAKEPRTPAPVPKSPAQQATAPAAPAVKKDAPAKAAPAAQTPAPPLAAAPVAQAAPVKPSAAQKQEHAVPTPHAPKNTSGTHAEPAAKPAVAPAQNTGVKTPDAVEKKNAQQPIVASVQAPAVPPVKQTPSTEAATVAATDKVTEPKPSYPKKAEVATPPARVAQTPSPSAVAATAAPTNPPAAKNAANAQPHPQEFFTQTATKPIAGAVTTKPRDIVILPVSPPSTPKSAPAATVIATPVLGKPVEPPAIHASSVGATTHTEISSAPPTLAKPAPKLAPSDAPHFTPALPAAAPSAPPHVSMPTPSTTAAKPVPSQTIAPINLSSGKTPNPVPLHENKVANVTLNTQPTAPAHHDVPPAAAPAAAPAPVSMPTHGTTATNPLPLPAVTPVNLSSGKTPNPVPLHENKVANVALNTQPTTAAGHAETHSVVIPTNLPTASAPTDTPKTVASVSIPTSGATNPIEPRKIAPVSMPSSIATPPAPYANKVANVTINAQPIPPAVAHPKISTQVTATTLTQNQETALENFLREWEFRDKVKGVDNPVLRDKAKTFEKARRPDEIVPRIEAMLTELKIPGYRSDGQFGPDDIQQLQKLYAQNGTRNESSSRRQMTGPLLPGLLDKFVESMDPSHPTTVNTQARPLVGMVVPVELSGANSIPQPTNAPIHVSVAHPAAPETPKINQVSLGTQFDASKLDEATRQQIKKLPLAEMQEKVIPQSLVKEGDVSPNGSPYVPWSPLMNQFLDQYASELKAKDHQTLGMKLSYGIKGGVSSNDVVTGWELEARSNHPKDKIVEVDGTLTRAEFLQLINEKYNQYNAETYSNEGRMANRPYEDSRHSAQKGELQGIIDQLAEQQGLKRIQDDKTYQVHFEDPTPPPATPPVHAAAKNQGPKR